MTSWMAALESQLKAIEVNDSFVRSTSDDRIRELEGLGEPWDWHRLRAMSLFERDLLKSATPFAWSAETTAAVLAASTSIPLDAVFNGWNIEIMAAWWHFVTPLPFMTVSNPLHKVCGISMGWADLLNAPKENGKRLGHEKRFAISTWILEESIIPSQSLSIGEDKTLGELLAETRASHMNTYSPGEVNTIGLEAFMVASEGILRFILAGWIWLNQKVLAQTEGHIERHRRKAFAKVTGQDLRGVKVVSLRRTEKAPGPPRAPGETDHEYQCRWVVDGHFRNQACGPGYRDRRLTWVGPYVKGPEEKPLRVAPVKVYVVDK